MPKIRMLTFYTFLLIALFFTVPSMAIVRKSDRKVKAVRKALATALVKLFPFKGEVIGDFDSSANVLVINHQSDLDIIYLEYIVDANLCWVAKKELGDIPLFGQLLKLPKMILIDRKDKREILKMIKTSKQRIKEGRVISIFPEGTRGDGKKLLPFKEGVKAIISASNSKIQPVIIKGSREVFDPKKFEIRKKEFSVEFLKAYKPDFSDNQWYNKLELMMKKRFES